MKVLGIACSPRKGGNTEILVGEALAGAREAGAEVEMVTLAGKGISPCDACAACTKTTKCKIDDDMQPIYSKLLGADGLIFGSPVYFWNVSAQAKALMDRTYCFRWKRDLKGRVAGAIVVAGRAGGSEAFQAFHNFFNLHRMISAGGAIGYAADEVISREERGGGAIAYGIEKGEVVRDKRGMFEARALGQAVVRSIRTLQGTGGRP